MRNARKILAYTLVAGLLYGMTMHVHAGSAMEEIYVTFERIYTENSEEYAVIEALNPDGSTAWTYETPVYECAQLDRITELGCQDDAYYLCEDGTIKKFALRTGRLLWENEDFSGSATDWLFDNEDTLYVCGYLGPDLYAVSADGETLAYIGMASKDMYWPYDISWQDENTIKIVYEGNEMGLEQEQDQVQEQKLEKDQEQGLNHGKNQVDIPAVYLDVTEIRERVQDADETRSDEDTLFYDEENGVMCQVVNCRESITLRTEPSTSASEICQIPIAAFVTYLGAAENGFYQVEFNGNVGYALASYLSFI